MQQFAQEWGRDQQRQRGRQPVHQHADQDQPRQWHRGQHPLFQGAVIGITAKQCVECKQPGQQHRQPKDSGGHARQGRGLRAQRQREQHHHQQREERRLQRIAATTPE